MPWWRLFFFCSFCTKKKAAGKIGQYHTERQTTRNNVGKVCESLMAGQLAFTSLTKREQDLVTQLVLSFLRHLDSIKFRLTLFPQNNQIHLFQQLTSCQIHGLHVLGNNCISFTFNQTFQLFWNWDCSLKAEKLHWIILKKQEQKQLVIIFYISPILSLVLSFSNPQV